MDHQAANSAQQHPPAGFTVSAEKAAFMPDQRFHLNSSWEVRFDEITGIAICNTIHGDADNLYLILICGDQKTVYFNMYTVTEELQNFHLLEEEVKKRFGVPIRTFPWVSDQTVLLYPAALRGEFLYQPWHSNIKTLWHALKRQLWLVHPASGIIRPAFIQKLR